MINSTKNDKIAIWGMWVSIAASLVATSYFVPWGLWFLMIPLIVIPILMFIPYLQSKIRQRKRVGIVQIYRNKTTADQRIKEAYIRTKKAKIFIVRGISDFVGDNSMFYNASTFKEHKDYENSIQLKQPPNGEVFVLVASEVSPLFSDNRYQDINEKCGTNKVNKDSLEQIENVIQALKRIQKVINLRYKKHTQAFPAKYYLFDDCGFVIFNEYYTKNDLMSPVLEIKPVKDQDSGRRVGLYAALDLYFDDVWKYFCLEDIEDKKGEKSE